MTARALLIGIGLALLMAATAYINDQVIQQTYLVGHYLPPSVFGVVAALWLGPLLVRRASGRSCGLRAGEVVVIAALALAAGGWAGNSFTRHFTPALATPWYWHRTAPHWQANQVMSYLPHGAPQIAAGQVARWEALAAAVSEAFEAEPPSPALAEMLGQLPSTTRQRLQAATSSRPLGPRERSELLAGLNRLIDQEALPSSGALAALPLPGRGGERAGQLLARDATLSQAQRRLLVREVLEVTLAGAVRPLPRGQPVLLSYEAGASSALDGYMQGQAEHNWLDPREVPWEAWWPTLRFWIPLLVGLSLTSLCLVLIVHPQWADRELLSYPIARFVEALLQARASDGRPGWLGRMFWFGLVSMLALHLLNGAAAYFPDLPSIPTRLDFGALRQLFPHAARVPGNGFLFEPIIFPAVVAFALLVPTQVTLSLGVSLFAWIAFAALLIRQGVSLSGSRMQVDAHGLLIFGAYLGCLATILYTGRWYYAQVARSALGGVPREVPRYAIWAARFLPGGLALMVATLIWGGLDWPMATLLVFGLVLQYLVLTRIAVETGAFYLQAHWVPISVLTALAGFEAIGPTAYLIMALVSVVLSMNLRDVLMPHLAHGVYLVSRGQRAAIGPVAGGMSMVLAATLVLSVGAAIYVQHSRGINWVGAWETRQIPSTPLNLASDYLAESEAAGTLTEAAQVSGVQRLAAVQWHHRNSLWVLAGATLFLGLALARLKLPWWPLHPVLFLVWGTHGVNVFAFSFLLGWMVKASVVNVGGARGYATVKPLAIGIICGELLASLGWSCVGAIYYGWTGVTPPAYRIFPM